MTTAALRGLLPAAAAVAAALLYATSAIAQGAESVDEALKKGDIADAKTQLEQAVKRNPADYSAALAYATILPPKEALKLADTLSRAPNAPGWAKARGLRISGDHHFMKEEYKKAADAYLHASTLDSAASTYKHLYALSIAMDGRTDAARTIWNGIALNKSDELSGEAARLSALMPKPAVTEVTTAAAVTQQPKTHEQPAAAVPVTPPTNSTPIPATVNTIKVDSVKTPPPPTNPPVAPVSQQINASAQTPPSTPPANPKPAEPAFTIQVGAFATKENADNLVRRLTGKYDDITISTTTSGDQTLYRVRVGTFKKKEDATAFADKLIIEAGLSARVMEK